MTKARKKSHPIHKHIHRVVKNTVVPHKKNNYQPHLIRRHGIIFVIAVAFIAQLGHGLAQTRAVLGDQTDVTRQRLLKDTNSARADHGLSPLRLDASLDQAATLKAEDMYAGQYWAHVSPSGVQPWHWFAAAKYDYNYAGENLAKGFRTSNGVITAWLQSEEHRKNLLNAQYKDVGFAVVPGSLEGERTMLVVALYGAPVTETLASTRQQETHQVLAASAGSISVIERIGRVMQSMSPVVIGSLALLALTVGVALAAHAYRRYLPRQLQKSWYRHHGLYKAVGMSGLIIAIIALYSGGQI